MHTSQKYGQHALVIGGGIAGLLAARVLLDHFEHVTIVERDHYSHEPVFRPGVPQGHHAHQLLVRGQMILEEMFPGFKNKLRAHGAMDNDFLADCVYNYGYGRSPRFPSQLKGLLCSRLLIEWQIRQELLQEERLYFLENHEVIGLTNTVETRTITGVRIRERGHVDAGVPVAVSQQEREPIAADLVVDSSGRSSHAPVWLQELGYEAPSETIINAFPGYATRVYAIPEQFSHNWNLIGTQGLPKDKLRGGGIFPIESKRWMAVLFGVGKDYPPTDEEGYLAFARSLPEAEIYEAIKDAKPLSPIYGYRQTENSYRHFERLRLQPTGFIALGDAVCSFNPIYGQGMMAAAQGVQVLDACLRNSAVSPQRFPHIFQKKLARVNKAVWQLATASDYRVPQTVGPEQKRVERWLFLYMERILPLLARDRQVTETFLSVLHFTRPSVALFHPSIAFKVLTQHLH